MGHRRRHGGGVQEARTASLKELGRAIVVRGAAFVRLPWKRAPLGRPCRDGLLPRLRRGRRELLALRRRAPRRLALAGANQPGAAATNASRSSAPAPSGITASSGAIRCRSSRLHRSASPGSAGQAPMTRPRTVSPRARSASTVSSVWLSVPRPAATTTTTSTSVTASSSDARSSRVPPGGVEPDQQPAGALDDHRVLGERPRSGRRTTPPAGSSTPWRRAAVSGASGSSSVGPLLGLDTGEPGDLAGVGVAVERAGLHGLHDEHRAGGGGGEGGGRDGLADARWRSR